MSLKHRRRTRPGAPAGMAAVELAALLPILCFIMLAAVDFGRAFYAWLTVADCARNGALYAAGYTSSSNTPYATYSAAALADAASLSPSPTVATPQYGTDSNGDSYVQITVSYTFQTIVTYPGISSSMVLSRTSTMMMAPP